MSTQVTQGGVAAADATAGALERLRSLMRDAAADPVAAAGLGRAGTSVLLRVDGEDALVLRLGEPDVGTSAPSGHEGIELELSGDQLEAFVRGRLPLALEILAGRVRYRGPVRHFLLVAPLLRSAARSDAAREDGA